MQGIMDEKSLRELALSITKKTFNRKSYRKKIRETFDWYIPNFKFLKKENEELYKQYISDKNNICKSLFEQLDKDSTFIIGNHIFLFSIIDSHFQIYKELSEKIKKNVSLIKEYYELIFEKNNELIKLLDENKKNPITLDKLSTFVTERNANDK